MKRFFKFLCVALVGIVCGVMCLGLTACEDIKKLSVNISVYDTSSNKALDKTITVDLYRHLAPETVDAILSYVNKGYYNDTLFYKNGDQTSQIMVGDYKFSDNAIAKYTQDYVNTVKGEFNANGVVGSDLSNVKGSLGLWRTWNQDDTFKTNAKGVYDSGMATLYMPTDSLKDYDGFFCVFGKINLEDENNSSAFNLLSAVFSNSSLYTSYTSYYLGSVFGDIAYCLEPTEDFNKKIDEGTIKQEDIFVPQQGQSREYAKRTVMMPVATLNNVSNTVTAKITSIKVK